MLTKRKIVDYINYYLEKIDLKISRASNFHRDWNEHFKHLKKFGFKPDNIFDVGVATKTDYLYENFPKAKMILVEPLKEYLPSLEKISEKYNSKIVLAAAGASEGSITINIPLDIGGATVFNVPEMSITSFEPRNVPMTTLDKIWNEQNLSGKTLIKLDVQGAELEVLKGSENVIKNTEILIIETNLFESFKGAPIFEDHIAYMASKGFMVYDIIGGGYTYASDRLGFVDLVYVKKEGLFDLEKRWFTEEQLHKISDNIEGVKRQ